MASLLGCQLNISGILYCPDSVLNSQFPGILIFGHTLPVVNADTSKLHVFFADIFEADIWSANTGKHAVEICTLEDLRVDHVVLPQNLEDPPEAGEVEAVQPLLVSDVGCPGFTAVVS